MTEIEKIPAEEVVVQPKPTAVKSHVGSDEFVAKFIEVIKGGDVWRSVNKLSKELNCDPNDLCNWMDHQPGLVRRPGKEEGVVYYAVASRIEAEAKKEKRPPGMERKVVSEEDRYAIGMLHITYGNLSAILEKYGMHIYNRNSEALAKLAEGKDAISAGIALFANTIQTDISKLPKLI